MKRKLLLTCQSGGHCTQATKVKAVVVKVQLSTLKVLFCICCQETNKGEVLCSLRGRRLAGGMEYESVGEGWGQLEIAIDFEMLALAQTQNTSPKENPWAKAFY